MRHHPLAQGLILSGIVLLATALRFYRLGAWSFWGDEFITVTEAQGPLAYDLTQPRISLILTAATLRAFGVSEWSARLVPALIGIVTIPVLYLPIRRVFGVAVALVASVLLAVSPWHLFWSQNARFYSMLMLLYTLGAFAFFLGIEEDRPWYVLASLLLIGLAVVERAFAGFFIPVAMLYVVLIRVLGLGKPQGLNVRNVAIMLLPVAAFILYDIWETIRGPRFTMTSAFVEQFVGNPNHGPLRLLFSLVFRLGIPMVVLGSVGGIRALAERRREGLFMLLNAVVPPMLLVLISPFTFTVDRYVFSVLPFWLALVSSGIRDAFVGAGNQGRVFAAGVVALLLATSMGDNALYYADQNGGRPDWRGAFAAVGREKADGDLVASTEPSIGDHYLGSVVEINNVDPTELEGGYRRAWFVIDEATGWVFPDVRQWIQQHCRLADVRDVHVPGKSLDIYVYLYDPAESVGTSGLN